MRHDRPRCLLVATDLTGGGDPVLRTAGALAAHVSAELHVVHVRESRSAEAAGEELARQVERSLPAGVAAASREVREGAVHEAVAARAQEVGADLLVLGPGSESAAGAHFLGSTADRLLRTSSIPCLVVRGELALPLGGLGVPVDFSPPSRQALRLAFRWAAALTGGGAGPAVRLVHVGSPVTRTDFPDHEETTLGPQLAAEIETARAETGAAVAAEAEVVWDHLEGQRICHWAEQRAIELLVVGTHGRSGLPRALLGSQATRLARQAPCPVLLVPPGEAGEVEAAAAPAFDRLLLATDFSVEAEQAAAWAAEHLAPEAELVLAHVASAPHPPPFLRRGLPAREALVEAAIAGGEERLPAVAARLPRPAARRLVREGRPAETIAKLARQEGADLVVVGGHGRREGLFAHLGSTAERLLGSSPVPVLVARAVEPAPPRHLLVPVDGSPAARRALVWATALAGRLDSRVTLLHVVSTGFLAAARRVSSEPVARELGERVREGVQEWLDELAAESGLPADRVTTVVEEGAPPLQILATAARLGCDLVVLASRGAGGGGLLGLGGVARSVVRHGAFPVLVVPPPP